MKELIFNRFVLIITAVACSGCLMGTPLQLFAIQMNIAVLLLNFAVFFWVLLLHIVKRGKIFTGISYTYLLLLSSLPVVASIIAFSLFGQDLISGFTGNLAFYNFYIILFHVFYFKFRNNALNEIKLTIVTLGWISLIVCYFVQVAFPGLEFTVPSFDGTTTYTYNLYSLGPAFIPWTGMYYLAKYKETAKAKYLLLFFLFISYIVVMQNARAFTLALLLCVIIFYLREFSLKGKWKLGFSIFVLLFISSILILAIPQLNNFFSDKVESFQAALGAASGKEVEEVSANARLLEVNIAYTYIQDYYLLGVGFLKGNTTEKNISSYFFASDIGLVGIVFNYGLIGLLLIGYQLKYFVVEFKNRILKADTFLLGTAYYMLLRYMLSVTTGELLYSIGLSFMLLGILIHGRRNLEGKLAANT